MRRMQNAGVSVAWVTWLEAYLERTRIDQLLAKATARIARPQLAATFSYWREDWDGVQQATRRQTAERQKAKVAAMRNRYATKEDGGERVQARVRATRAHHPRGPSPHHSRGP